MKFYNFKTELFFLCILFSAPTILVAQNKYWTQTGIGGGNDEGLSISIDDSNNTYTTGYFSGSITFGNTRLSTSGITDVFVVKTNSLGVFQWAVKDGDQGEDRGLAIKTDANGNSYVTGYYFGKAVFGSKVINSVGLQDVFVAKYDFNGNVKWVVDAGGRGADMGNAITLDNSGNVLITGQFMDTAEFGTDTLIAVKNNINVFTAKLDSSNGKFLWAKSGTGPHIDRGMGVACDPSGNVYVMGQFTDTITFDNVHDASFYNAIFIVKYNGGGNEQWFTKAGGGIYDVAGGIAVDNNSNVYITGSFTGTLYFYAQHFVSLTNTYANRIFIAKYDQNANLLWDVADGSKSALNSNTIALDGAGNPYIMGNFKCRLNGYADRYGQGTFNTVGYWDIFAAEYSASNGAWQWGRQLGGHGNNYGNSIAVSSQGDVYTTCSFNKDMIIPWDTNYVGYSLTQDWYCPICYYTKDHCFNSYYGNFQHYSTNGNLGIFIAKPFYLGRPTYDYYYRSDSTCERPYVGVCITKEPCTLICQDTISMCGGGYICADVNSQWSDGQYCDYKYPGPYFSWIWSNKQAGFSMSVNSNGEYYVTQTSEDGCFVSTDSTYVIIHPLPPKPTITDNVVINNNSAHPTPIHLCRDSVTITGGNYGSNKYYWFWDYHIVDNVKSLTLNVPDDTTYSFVVVDSNGCMDSTTIRIRLDSLLPRIVPAIFCPICKHDTAYLCSDGRTFSLFVYDTISNPTHKGICIPPSNAVNISWNVTPNSITYFFNTGCGMFGDENLFTPKSSGWYYITGTLNRNNLCGSDVHFIKDSIYMFLDPPIKASVSSKPYFCPNDGEWLVESGGTTHYWSNDYLNKTDSDWVISPGSYDIDVFDKYGCDTLISVDVNTSPLPVITMNPSYGVVCPGDSVELSTPKVIGTLSWVGPLGPIGGNTNNIYVKTPGNYIVVEKDTSGCILVSNTVQVNLYATPFLLATPDVVLCQGDTAAINVIASPGANIQWQPPLNGNDSVQYVHSSGTYVCKITSCGIITMASVTITFSNPKAIITASPSTVLCPNGDSITLTANNGMIFYVWYPDSVTGGSFTTYQAGTYSLTTYDNYGCSASTSIVINPFTPLRDTMVRVTNVLCNGNNDGKITLGMKGGSLPYIYSWSNGATIANLSGLSIGTYSVLVQERCGTTDTASFTITQPPVLKDSIASLSHVLCNGNNTGSITVGVQGGAGGYIYSWSPMGGSTATASALSAGTYVVTVKDVNGCTQTASAIITQPVASLAGITSATNISCNGGSDGSATATVSGGTPVYTYSWNPGGQVTPIATGLSVGAYTVTVTDSAGCAVTSSVSVTQPNAISISITTIPATCVNNDGSISASVSGGTLPYTYLWNPGGGVSASYSGLSAGSYKVTISDAHGCADTVSGNVTTANNLNVTIAGPDSVCKGQSIILTASGASSYIWSTSNTSSSIAISLIVSTSYWVVGSEGPCVDSARHSIGIYPPLSAKIPFMDSICSGKPVSIRVNLTGGKAPYSYTWNNGINADSPGPIIVNPINSTTYVVNISDACNYAVKDSVTISISKSGLASFNVMPDSLVIGQVVSINNTSIGEANYYWAFGDGSISTDFEPNYSYSAIGYYQIILIAYNPYGCQDTAVKDLYVTNELVVPNVFTPNGDGINDILYFTVKEAHCFHCNIYNRWGVLVYELNNVNEGWNGTIRQTGDPAAGGTYYYIINYCDYKNASHNMDGSVQLIRDK